MKIDNISDKAFLNNIPAFLIIWGKSIILFAFASTLITFFYLSMQPDAYKATALIKIGKYSDIQHGSGGLNIEEPAVLSTRIYFDLQKISAKESCKFFGRDDIKIRYPKGMPDTIELTVIGNQSSAVLQDCALSIFNYIESTQAALLEPYISGIKSQISEYDNQLKTLTEKNHSSKNGSSTYGLPKRDDELLLFFLLKERANLAQNLSMNRLIAARLIMPITVELEPLWPKRGMFFLVLSALAGLLAGVAYAAFRNFWFSRNPA